MLAMQIITPLAPRLPVILRTSYAMDLSSFAVLSIKCSAPQSMTSYFFARASIPITRMAIPLATSWTAILPNPPPTPEMTAHCPDVTLNFLKAAYVVTPAQSMGAASAELSPSGIGVK